MRAVSLLVSVILISLPAMALGQQVYVDTAITAGAGFDDNPLLQSDEEADTEADPDPDSLSSGDQTFALIGFGIELGSDTPDSQRAVILDASLRRYDDDSLDSESYSLVFNGEKQGLTRDYIVEAGISQDSTLETELSDSGLLDTNVDRRRLFVSPGMTLRISETWNLDLDAGYSQVRFSEDTDLVEYDEVTAGAELGYRLTERLITTAGVDVILYRPEGTVAANGVEEDDSYRFLLGVEYQLNEQSTLDFTIGPAFRETRIAGGSTLDGEEVAAMSVSSDSLAYALDYTLEGLRGRSTLGLSQAEESTALGGLSEVRSVNVGSSYYWSERSTASLNLSYSERDAVTVGEPEREYYEINPGIDLEASQHLSVGLNYYYRKENERTTPDTPARSADSNSFVIDLRYEFGRRFL